MVKTMHTTQLKSKICRMLHRKNSKRAYNKRELQEDLDHEAEFQITNQNDYFKIHVEAFQFIKNGFRFALELNQTYSRAQIMIDHLLNNNIHLRQEFSTMYDSEDEEYEYPTSFWHSSLYSAEDFVDFLNWLEESLGKKGFEPFFIYADKLTHTISELKNTIYCECRR